MTAAEQLLEEVGAGLESGRLPFLVQYGPPISGKSDLLRDLPELLKKFKARIFYVQVDFRKIALKKPSEPHAELGRELWEEVIRRDRSLRTISADLDFHNMLEQIAAAADRKGYWGTFLSIDHVDALPNEGIRVLGRQLKLLQDRKPQLASRMGLLVTSRRSLYWLKDQGTSPFVGYDPIVATNGRTAGASDALRTAIEEHYREQNESATVPGDQELARWLVYDPDCLQSVRRCLLHLATNQGVCDLAEMAVERPASALLRSMVPDYDEYEETGLFIADRARQRYDFRNNLLREAVREALPLLSAHANAPDLPDDSIAATLRSVAAYRARLEVASSLSQACEVWRELWKLVAVGPAPEFYFRTGDPSAGGLWMAAPNGGGVSIAAAGSIPGLCLEAAELSAKRRFGFVMTDSASAAYWHSQAYENIPMLLTARIHCPEGTAWPNETNLRHWNDLVSGQWEPMARLCLIEYGKHRLQAAATAAADPKSVFVVYGRDLEAKRTIEGELEKVGLDVIEWETARHHTGKPTASNLEILQAGLSKARAVVVVMSGDDVASLRKELNVKKEPSEAKPTAQPRQNVLIEAGMAVAIYPGRTLLVSTGPLRNASDFAGLNLLKYADTVKFRAAFEARLRDAGCHVTPRDRPRAAPAPRVRGELAVRGRRRAGL